MSVEWITREGVSLKPRQMTTGHLTNALKMLERKAEARNGCLLGPEIPGGVYERGMMAGEIWMDREEIPMADHPVYSALKEELDKRTNQ
jgi:hypothetical protein